MVGNIGDRIFPEYRVPGLGVVPLETSYRDPQANPTPGDTRLDRYLWVEISHIVARAWKISYHILCPKVLLVLGIIYHIIGFLIRIDDTPSKAAIPLAMPFCLEPRRGPPIDRPGAFNVR